MSGQNPPVEQEPDDAPYRRVVLVGVLAIVIFAVSIWIARHVEEGRYAALLPDGPAPAPRAIGGAEIGIVNQHPFAIDRRPDRYLDASARRLASWGWVNRAAGIVHMPIDEAIDRVIAGANK